MNLRIIHSSVLLILILALFAFTGCSKDSSITGSPEELPAEHFYTDASFVDSETGWVVGTKGGIFKTTNGGRIWINQTFTDDEDFLAVDFGSKNYGVIASERNAFITKDGGESWEICDIDFVTGVIVKILLVSEQLGFIAPQTSGVLLRTSDGGESWRRTYFPSDQILIKQIDFPTKEIGYCTTNLGIIYRTEDSGKRWHNVSAPRFAESLNFITEHIGFAGNNVLPSSVYHDSASVFKTTDAGNNWNEFFKFDQYAVWQVKFLNPLKGLLIAGSLDLNPRFEGEILECGNLMFTTNGGITWQHNENNPSYSNVIDIEIVGDNSAFILNASGEVILTHISE